MKRKAIIESLRHRHKDADYNRHHLSTSEARFIEEGKFQAYSVALRMLGEEVPLDGGEARSAVREVSTRIRDMALKLERFTEENPHAPVIEINDETNTATISPPPSDPPAMIRLYNGDQHVYTAAFNAYIEVAAAHIADTVTVTGYKLYTGAGDCIQEGTFDPVQFVPQGPAISLDALTIGYDDDEGSSDLWHQMGGDDDDTPDDEPATLHLPRSVYVLESPNNRGVCGTYFLSREDAQAACDSMPINFVVCEKDVALMYGTPSQDTLPPTNTPNDDNT